MKKDTNKAFFVNELKKSIRKLFYSSYIFLYGFHNQTILPEFGVHPSKWVVKNRNSSEKSEL